MTANLLSAAANVLRTLLCKTTGRKDLNWQQSGSFVTIQSRLSWKTMSSEDPQERQLKAIHSKIYYPNYVFTYLIKSIYQRHPTEASKPFKSICITIRPLNNIMKVQKQQWQKCCVLTIRKGKKRSSSIILNIMKNDKIFSLYTTSRSFLLESIR